MEIRLPQTQSFESHSRYFPAHHFFVQPILTATFLLQLGRFIDARTFDNGWLTLLAFALLVFSFTSRQMALTAQNRIIRLEEKLRLTKLMPPDDHARIDELRPGHFVGLRFADDSEVVDLARRCLSGELRTAKDVKQNVKSWRPDLLRV